MSLLLDTGALVTLLDRSQPNHRAFAAFFKGWRGAVVSTEAVLTESSHLLGRVVGGRAACLDFFLIVSHSGAPPSDREMHAGHGGSPAGPGMRSGRPG
jgi:hypothetical protein